MQVELRHDELQQPLGGQAPRGCVTGGRRHGLLQDGASKRLHLSSGSSESLSQAHNQKRGVKKGKAFYLCGAEDDSVIVLSSAGPLFLIPPEADGHRAEAVINPKEVLVFWKKIKRNGNITFIKDKKYELQ